MTTTYAKGQRPLDLDAAQGGLVLARTRNFAKDQDDDEHPLGTGLNGPINQQEYCKDKNNYPNVHRRVGDTKAEKPVRPRK
jgi:hypothetical protein